MMPGMIKLEEIAVVRQSFGNEYTCNNRRTVRQCVLCVSPVRKYSHGSQQDPCGLEPRVTLLATISGNLLRTQN
jgi:hypothetical protein